MLIKALEAAEILSAKGIKARVVNIHTIKPIDRELLMACAKAGPRHGQGAASMAGSAARSLRPWRRVARCRSSLSASKTPSPSRGDYEKLLAKYGLSAANIVAHAEKVLQRKK